MINSAWKPGDTPHVCGPWPGCSLVQIHTDYIIPAQKEEGAGIQSPILEITLRDDKQSGRQKEWILLCAFIYNSASF